MRVSLPHMVASSVAGLWTAEFSASAGAGTVDAVEAFVEGAGRDSSGRPGLSAAKFELGVVYEGTRAAAQRTSTRPAKPSPESPTRRASAR